MTSPLHAHPFIAADVGGTHARMALVRAANGGVDVLHFHQYECARYPSLAVILRDFLGQLDRSVSHAVVAVPGVVAADTVTAVNLPWKVWRSQTRDEVGLSDLALVNDFEAVACATPYIEPTAITQLYGPAQAAEGPTLVIGPGTGFGSAVRLPGAPARVLASEAGHAALAPGNDREIEILRRLQTRWPHVDNERALSGPGLLNLYTALCEIEGVTPRFTAPAEIARAAQDGSDALAREALTTFCALLGSLAGDLALCFGAKSVYLAGGIPAQIKPFLLASDFVPRYLNKGGLRSVLEPVPVWLIDHGQLGLIGAAAWYLDNA